MQPLLSDQLDLAVNISGRIIDSVMVDILGLISYGPVHRGKLQRGRNARHDWFVPVAPVLLTLLLWCSSNAIHPTVEHGLA